MNYDKKKQELELRKLEAETELKELEVIAKQLENTERQKNIQITMADTYISQLAASAKKLDIESNKATVIDITNIINAHRSNNL